jgi:hypothetical protein
MRSYLIILSVFIPAACLAGGPNPTKGSVFQTADAPRDVILENGVAIRVGARSAGTIYGDHAVLEQGALHLSHFADYRVVAGQLFIESETPGAEAVIRLESSTIEVASLGGAVTVSDGGAMLTRVAAGSKMAFQNSGAAPGRTGAAPAPKPRSNMKTWLWVVGGIAAAALVIGLTAAAQGKSPY